MNLFSILSRFFCFALLILLVSGCATVLHGPSQKLAIATNPPGATVSDGVVSATTPTVLTLKRKNDHVLTITKPGYETVTVPITHVMGEAVAMNIFSFGLIGWGIDAMTGSQFDLIPKTVDIVLKPLRPWEKALPPVEKKQ